MRQALYASKISAYAQGMAMLRMASEEYGYKLNLGEMAAIWRAGCIMESRTPSFGLPASVCPVSGGDSK